MDHPPDLPPGNRYIPLVDGAYDPPVPPSNKKALSDRSQMLYNIGLGASVALLSCGPGIYDSHPLIGGGFTAAGAAGLIGLVLLLIWYRVRSVHGLIAALVITSIALVYVFWTKPKEVIVHDPPTAEDIKKTTAPIQNELDVKTQELTTVTTDRDAQKKRADSATQQLATYQTQFPTLQSNLAAATNERDNFQRSLEETTSLLNATRARLGPQSPVLKLDDARRWQVVKSMVEGMPSSTQQGCIVDQAFDNRNQADYHRSADIWGEVEEPLFFAGWRFTQVSKAFFPPGISITVGAKSGYAHECATRLKDLLDGLNIRPSIMRVDDGAADLTTCSNQCIEVTIGKLDAP